MSEIYKLIDNYTKARDNAAKLGLIFTPNERMMEGSIGTWICLDEQDVTYEQQREIKADVEAQYRSLCYNYELSQTPPTQKYDAFIERNQTIIDTTSIILGVVGVTLGVVNFVQYHLQKKK